MPDFNYFLFPHAIYQLVFPSPRLCKKNTLMNKRLLLERRSFSVYSDHSLSHCSSQLQKGKDNSNRNWAQSAVTISHITCKWSRIYYSYTCAPEFKSSGSSSAWCRWNQKRCVAQEAAAFLTARGPPRHTISSSLSGVCSSTGNGSRLFADRRGRADGPFLIYSGNSLSHIWRRRRQTTPFGNASVKSRRLQYCR
jgi:hypothetical protein